MWNFCTFALAKVACYPTSLARIIFSQHYNMERNKQIQTGLLALLALLLIANLFGGGFKNWFGKGDLRESAASVLGAPSTNPSSAVGPSYDGNIPGTNVNAPAAPTGPTTAIEYEKEGRFDFGTVDEGEIVKHVFKFKNVGSEPLVISNCKGSCGCTVPTWPKEPIPPGANGEINVEFNSRGKVGSQSKRVTVTANTNPTETFLEIRGEVRGKEQPSAKGDH